MANFSETKEFYDLRVDFENTFSHMRLDRESKEVYKVGAYYQSGETNNAFKAFLHGYQTGRCVYLNQ